MKLLLLRARMFALEVKVEAFASKDSTGRKSYTKGRVFKWDVEYGSLTLDLLLKHLANEMNLCTNQTPTVWFFDKRLNEDVRLVDEIQMVDLFEMHKEEMTCQVIVGVFDSAICVEHEFDALEPLCVVPPNDAAKLSTHDANIPKQPSNGGTEPITLPCAAPKNPEVADELEPDREATREAAREPDREVARELDIFDKDEEYVGVDDEAMYDEAPPTEFAQPQPFDNANTHATADPSDDFIHVDVVDDADPLEINVLHDPKNLKIVKGELFPDIIAFRKALRHYAVKTGFELAPGYKTDKQRFIAKCAAEGCPWRIHAFTIFDKKTI